MEVKTLQFISPLLSLLLSPLLHLHSPLSSPSHPPTLPPYRRLLEEFYYSDLVSVNEEEPPTFHTLIFTFHARVDNSLVEYLF